MDGVDGDSEEEKSDGDLTERRGERLEDLAEEPVSQGYLCICYGESLSVLPGSVSNASNLADEIDRE